MKSSIILSLCIFVSAGLYAQGTIDPVRTAELRARSDSARVRNYPPAGAGLSEAGLAEYGAIIGRYRTSPDMPFFSYANKVTPADGERLRTLFGEMTRAQQLAQNIVFMRMDRPREARPLTDAELAAFRDTTQYRVLADFRPVDAATLAAYTPADIWWYEVNPSMIKHAGSAYFTRDVRVQTRATHDIEAKRYAQYGDTYQMVFVSTRMRGERVERPAN